MSFGPTHWYQTPELSSVDAAVAGVATDQFGLVTFGQLRAAGLSKSSIQLRMRHGRLHRVHRGVYAVGHAALSLDARRMAALLAVGPGAALSHRTAAEVWGVWRGRPQARLDVTTSRRRRAHHDGVRVHESRTLHPAEVTWRGGLFVTTVARTIVDLADVTTADRIAAVIHEAAYYELFSLDDTRASIERNRHRPGGHVAIAERAIELHLSGSAGSRSELERRVHALLRAASLPAPRVNTPVPVLDGTIEVDLFWPAHRLVVEIDGIPHRRPRSRREDARRDARLRAAGYRVIRIPADLVDRHPDLAVRLVVDALAA